MFILSFIVSFALISCSIENLLNVDDYKVPNVLVNFFKFAAKMQSILYCSTLTNYQWKQLSTNDTDTASLIDISFSSSPIDVMFMTAYDPSKNYIIVSYRASYTRQNW
jgi:hypothetical protein